MSINNNNNMEINIRYVIDIDGFPLKSDIYYKEVGIYDIWKEVMYLYHIKLPLWFLHQGKSKEIAFCERHVHGMAFRNFDGDITQEILVEHLHSLDPNKQYLWAYKGGTVEKKLLSMLGFRHVNIEMFGCPKVEKVMVELEWNNSKLSNCHRHTNFSKTSKRSCHCSGVEVVAFGMWLKVNVDRIQR